jgi:CheY-like chemotaxis protein
MTPHEGGDTRTGGDAPVDRAREIAQELTNAHTTILGIAELMRGEVQSVEAREDLDSIMEQARRGAALTRSLIALFPGATDVVGASGDMRGATPAGVAAEASLELSGTETLLVVEDEAPVRDVICRALRARGYTVLEGTNGEDAIAAASRFNAPIHLVVSDVVMPEMDGRALFEKLRTWYPAIKFILISGYTRGAILPEHLEGAPAHFMAKPFTTDALVAQVRRILDE